MIEFKVIEKEDFSVVCFKVDVLTPKDLRDLEPPCVDARKGVVLSGRGPIWLYGTLIHIYHPVLWVATYDPRIGGAIVVESHSKDKKVGDVILMPPPEM